MNLTCRSEVRGRTATLKLSGTVNEEGAALLKEAYGSLPESISELVIDMGDLTYIGSSGIGKLLLFYKSMATRNGTIRLVRLPQPVYDLFKELRLDTLFSISTAG